MRAHGNPRVRRERPSFQDERSYYLSASGSGHGRVSSSGPWRVDARAQRRVARASPRIRSNEMCARRSASADPSCVEGSGSRARWSRSRRRTARSRDLPEVLFFDRDARGVGECAQPVLLRGDEQIARRARPIVELDARHHENTASRQEIGLRPVEPPIEQRPNARLASRLLQRGRDHQRDDRATASSSIAT